MDDVPEHLIDALIDAPFNAAQRLFDTAISEPVDFLVFAGDVYHPHTGGVRSLDFLVRQFQRLADLNIRIYWAGGLVDPSGRLPAVLTDLPNVHIFPKNKVQEVTHYRGEDPVAMLCGKSYFGGRAIRAADFRPDPNGLFSIATTYGDADPELLERQAIDYWAIGGLHQRQTLYSGNGTAHYAGILQGRSFDTPGKHGCSLISVDEQGNSQMSFLPVDTGRLHNEVIEIDDDADIDQLDQMMRARVKSLADSAGGRFTLIWWTVINSGRIAEQLRFGPLARELTQALQQDFGYCTPSVWTVAVMSELRDAWTDQVGDQNTLRGDYLNLVRQYRLDVSHEGDVKKFLSNNFLEATVSEEMAALEPTRRRRVLDDAAFLGSGLLQGEQPDSDDSSPTDTS